jgi:hypothetical protein
MRASGVVPSGVVPLEAGMPVCASGCKIRRIQHCSCMHACAREQQDGLGTSQVLVCDSCMLQQHAWSEHAILQRLARERIHLQEPACMRPSACAFCA